jgi:hypothetical protein
VSVTVSESAGLLSLGFLVFANVGAVYGFAVRLRTQFDDHRAHIDGRLDRLQQDLASAVDRESACRLANETAHQAIRATALSVETYQQLQAAAREVVDRDRAALREVVDRDRLEVFKRLERLEGKVDALPARIQNGHGSGRKAEGS